MGIIDIPEAGNSTRKVRGEMGEHLLDDASPFSAVQEALAALLHDNSISSHRFVFAMQNLKEVKKRNNSTKKRTLEIFQDQKWMDVPTFARRAGMHPVRRVYSYLAHLEKLNLLVRGYDIRRKLHYRITPRGLARLAWLRPQPEPPTVVQWIVAQLPLKDPSAGDL